ncbi:hypothetical protein [Streptomyces sp. NPDC015130]|uniref:hypothetical protein n=1 Tax=Streptomyces sp. NPDC015130 TaxID=3364940 RepID=UPI0036F5EE51
MEQNEPCFDAIRAGGSHPDPDSATTDGAFGLDLDALFEFGLQRTLDGIASMIDETSG